MRGTFQIPAVFRPDGYLENEVRRSTKSRSALRIAFRQMASVGSGYNTGDAPDGEDVGSCRQPCKEAGRGEEAVGIGCERFGLLGRQDCLGIFQIGKAGVGVFFLR